MKDAPCKDPLHCLLGCPLGCICIGNCYMRHKVLEGNMDAYLCCQGYYDKACWKAGSVGDQGNPCCLACEGARRRRTRGRFIVLSTRRRGGGDVRDTIATTPARRRGGGFAPFSAPAS